MATPETSGSTPTPVPFWSNVEPSMVTPWAPARTCTPSSQSVKVSPRRTTPCERTRIALARGAAEPQPADHARRGADVEERSRGHGAPVDLDALAGRRQHHPRGVHQGRQRRLEDDPAGMDLDAHPALGGVRGKDGPAQAARSRVLVAGHENPDRRPHLGRRGATRRHRLLQQGEQPEDEYGAAVQGVRPRTGHHGHGSSTKTLCQELLAQARPKRASTGIDRPVSSASTASPTRRGTRPMNGRKRIFSGTGINAREGHRSAGRRGRRRRRSRRRSARGRSRCRVSRLAPERPPAGPVAPRRDVAREARHGLLEGARIHYVLQDRHAEDQGEAPTQLEGHHVALDEDAPGGDAVGRRAAPRLRQHRGRQVDAGDLGAAPGEHPAPPPDPAAHVQDLGGRRDAEPAREREALGQVDGTVVERGHAVGADGLEAGALAREAAGALLPVEGGRRHGAPRPCCLLRDSSSW